MGEEGGHCPGLCVGEIYPIAIVDHSATPQGGFLTVKSLVEI